MYEFMHLIHEGASPQRSAFPPGFFALVGTRPHVALGILWLRILMMRSPAAARSPRTCRRLMPFVHVLALLTPPDRRSHLVYLMGSLP
jgi:cytochrome o ubiquinol oxidase subunit 3